MSNGKRRASIEIAMDHAARNSRKPKKTFTVCALQAAPRCKQAGKRRTLRPPVLKKSNPVSQGEDDALKMSNPPRWRHRVRFFRRAIRVRARGFEISVRLGEQPTNQENTELKKSISKKDFQVKKMFFGRRRPRALLTAREHRRVRIFDGRSSLATQGSNFNARAA